MKVSTKWEILEKRYTQRLEVTKMFRLQSDYILRNFIHRKYETKNMIYYFPAVALAKTYILPSLTLRNLIGVQSIFIPRMA